MINVFEELHLLLVQTCDGSLVEEWEAICVKRQSMFTNEPQVQIEWITGFFSLLFQNHGLTGEHHYLALKSIASCGTPSAFIGSFSQAMVPILNEENISIY